MTNKKTLLSILIGVMVISTSSAIYINENSYVNTSYGVSQYNSNMSFDWKISGVEIIAVATVEDVGIELLESNTGIDIDENGNEYIAHTEKRPYQKIMLVVDHYFKDTTGNFSEKLIVYDWASGKIGESDGVKTMFYREDVQTYNIGDKHFYLIEKNSDHDDKYIINGFSSRYDITAELDGTQYIQSYIDKVHYDNPAKLYLDAVNESISKGNEEMTLKMIETRDMLLSETGQ